MRSSRGTGGRPPDCLSGTLLSHVGFSGRISVPRLWHLWDEGVDAMSAPRALRCWAGFSFPFAAEARKAVEDDSMSFHVGLGWRSQNDWHLPLVGSGALKIISEWS